MKKVEFIKDEKFGRHEKPADIKYTLLALFIGQYRFPDNIQEIIDMLEEVRNGNRTWAEIIAPVMFLPIGYDSGDFKCDKETAYFISNARPETEPNMQIPLQELIDIMKEWKIFMS